MKKLAYILISLTLILTACNDDEFLVQDPHSPSDQAFYRSEAGAFQGIIAAYDILQYGEYIERTELRGVVCSGDAMTGGEPGGIDQQSLQDYMKFLIYPNNLYVGDYYNRLYIGVYRTNQIIRYLEEDKENLDAGFNEELREQLVGEAYFLRGLFHFKLQINYGGFSDRINNEEFGGQMKGIVFADQVLPPDGGGLVRPELSETWSKIEQDFIDAAALLSEKSELSADNMGRATKGAANAMLAKTYLYQEKWPEAYAAAKLVIESGEYWLPGDDAHTGPYTITRPAGDENVSYNIPGYGYIWQPEGNNGGESIFDVQHFADGTTRFPQGQEGNLVPRYYGPRALLDTIAVNWPDRADGATDTLLSTDTEYFWGFILPTEYFIQTAYDDIGCEVSGEILDPRYKLSVVENGDNMPVGNFGVSYSFTYTNTSDERVEWDSTITYPYGDSLGYSGWYNWPCTGRCTWKYFTDPVFSNAASTLGDYPQNTKYLRFADLLLIGAEAAVQSGHQADADIWVNWVRQRARNAGNTGYPQNIAGVTVADILAERRVELAFEGHQFFDIVRTGRAQEVLVEEAMSYMPVTTNPFSLETAPQQFGDNFQVGKHEILPIPQREIQQSNGTVTQNPNY